MISWCAYCQTFQGQREPFDDFSLSHGLCPSCRAKGRTGLAKAEDSARKVSALYERLRAAVREEARVDVTSVIEAQRKLGLSALDLCIGMIQPVLVEVGLLWERGEVTPADERKVSKMADEVILRLRASTDSVLKPSADEQVDALLTCVEGNIHTLGVRITEIALRDLGISTEVHAYSMKNEDLFKILRSKAPRILGLSVALPEHLVAVRELAKSIESDASLRSTKILVGGGALRADSRFLDGLSNVLAAPPSFPELKQLLEPLLRRA